jgi:sugar-specific transcriptional regulator TrmB
VRILGAMTTNPETEAASDTRRRLIESLAEFGLTLNQSRLYLSMLEGGSGTAHQLADRSNVPRTRVYEVLESLEKAGLCSARAERVAVYEAVPPEIALTEWAARRQQERRLADERDHHLRDVLLAKLPRFEPTESPLPVEFMEALVGTPRVVEVLEDEIATATERLDIVMAPPVFQPRERWNILETEAIERGVHVRVLYTADVVADPERFDKLLRAGGEGRVSSGIPLKIVLRDRVDAMVALRDGQSDASRFAVVRIKHPDLVAPLQLLFDREWRRGKPLQLP